MLPDTPDQQMFYPRRHAFLLVPAAVAVAVCISAAAVAHSQVAPSVDLTAEQVRTAYVAAGQVVGALAPSDDGVVSLLVSDPRTGTWQHPTLRVFVYADTAAATAQRAQAYARAEPERIRAMLDGQDIGPPLLTGYGLSVWRQNVSVVQAAPSDDVGAWPIEVDCTVDGSSQQAILPWTRVDPGYIAPLQAVLDSRK